MPTAENCAAPRTSTVLRVTALLLACQYTVLILWRLLDTGFLGSDSYSRIAQLLIDQGCFTTAFRPPVYPSFLALTMLSFGSAWEAAALVLQALCGITCGILLVSAAARLSPKSEYAIPAAALYVSNLLFHIEVVSKRETALFTLLLALFFYAALFYKDVVRRNSIMALSAALALLTRPNAVVLIPIIAAVVLAGLNTAGRWRRIVLPLVLFGAGLVPWQIVVWKQVGRLPLSSSANSGQTLWKGNNPYLLQIWPYVDVDKLDPLLREHLGDDITTAESDNRMLREALQFIREQPAVAFARALHKSILFFSPVPLPLGNAEVRLHEGGLALAHFRYRDSIQLAAGTVHGIVLLAGWLAFLFFEWRSAGNSFFVRASLALALLLCALHAMTYPESRYRQPFDITATPLAAAGLMLAFRRRTELRTASVVHDAAQAMSIASPRI